MKNKKFQLDSSIEPFINESPGNRLTVSYFSKLTSPWADLLVNGQGDK